MKLESRRIIGVETEFGCWADPNLFDRPEHAVELIKDYLFEHMKIGLIDLSARDEVFEPARSGGFLRNGGRLYIDSVGSHLEYATAECLSLNDVVANDRAGQRLILRAISELGLQDAVKIYNNSVDHFGGHTFGCHENYLVTMEEDFFTTQIAYLVPFLVTRQIFAGVGRVGGHSLSSSDRLPDYADVSQNPVDYIWVSNVYGVVPDSSVPFQLSQRADHILKVVASRVRFNRAIVNPKWEHFYSYNEQQRLHLLYGESNQNEFAYKLKIGTTALVLQLIEGGLVPDSIFAANPIHALRTISRDQTYQWIVRLLDGSSVRATDLQRRYLELAQRFRGQSEDTDWTLTNWELILDELDRNPLSLGDKLDWVAKRNVVEEYRANEGMDWNDDVLHSVDLEYHNIDPDLGLFYALREMGQTHDILDKLDIIDAMTEPPQNTRAKARSQIIRDLMAAKVPRYYSIDWSGVVVGQSTFFDLTDPFSTEISDVTS